MISEVTVNGNIKNVHEAGGISQMTQIYIDYASLPSSREITLEKIRLRHINSRASSKIGYLGTASLIKVLPRFNIFCLH
jgi:hypothetical protein